MSVIASELKQSQPFILDANFVFLNCYFVLFPTKVWLCRMCSVFFYGAHFRLPFLFFFCKKKEFHSSRGADFRSIQMFALLKCFCLRIRNRFIYKISYMIIKVNYKTKQVSTGSTWQRIDILIVICQTELVEVLLIKILFEILLELYSYPESDYNQIHS